MSNSVLSLIFRLSPSLIQAIVLASLTALSACDKTSLLQPAPARPTFTGSLALDATQTLTARVSFVDSPDFSIRAIQQPTLLHRATDIRSSRVELFRCTTQAAAQAADPSAQGACTAAGSQTRNHPAGLASLSFSLGNLRQNSFYSARVSAYTAADLGGVLMGSAWPVQNAGLRELIRADANGSLSLINDVAPVNQLDILLQLGNTSAGGSVSQNTLSVVNGSVLINDTGIGLELSQTETLANTYTISSQTNPALATDIGGNLVSVWESNAQDGSNSGIFAQRYDSVGMLQGSEFQVNTYTNLNQSNPQIARAANTGAFVITWMSEGQDSSSWGIYARLYDNAGIPAGPEFLVNNTFTASAQEFSSVAMDETGNFVVVWSGNGVGSSWGIFAQRYDSLGAPVGGPFLVNSVTTINAQPFPKVAMDAAGNFVIAWRGNGAPDSAGIYTRRYTAAGTALGTEALVNTSTLNVQQEPVIAINPSNGKYAVAWMSDAQDGNGWGVYAQRFHSDGAPRGGEFQVNTYTTGHQQAPALAMNSNGNFMVSWQSADQDGNLGGIYAQRYNLAGTPQGSEFRVNTTTLNQQQSPALANSFSEITIHAWQSTGQDGSLEGIYIKRFYTQGQPL